LSLEDLLADDTMTISRPDPTKDTSGGQVRTPATVVYSNVPVRVETARSTQMNAFGEREVVTTQVLLTQQTGIENGDIATLSDGTILRLILSYNSNRTLGNIDDYYEIEGQQVGQLVINQVGLAGGGFLELVGDGDLLLVA
jgi:hypothetical protein